MNMCSLVRLTWFHPLWFRYRQVFQWYQTFPGCPLLTQSSSWTCCQWSHLLVECSKWLYFLCSLCFPARLIKSRGGVPGYWSCDRLCTLCRLTYVNVARLQIFPASFFNSFNTCGSTCSLHSCGCDRTADSRCTFMCCAFHMQILNSDFKAAFEQIILNKQLATILPVQYFPLGL